MTRMQNGALLGFMAAALVLAALPAGAQQTTLQVEAQVVDSGQPMDNTVAIKGRIFDDETGETMPYTNVYISGTNIGTMAFTDGFYIMRGLPAGTYTVKASYISYTLGTQTVTLAPGEVANLDFRLEVHAILAEPFDVAAERAIIEVERTGSSHFISSKFVLRAPVKSANQK